MRLGSFFSHLFIPSQAAVACSAGGLPPYRVRSTMAGLLGVHPRHQVLRGKRKGPIARAFYGVLKLDYRCASKTATRSLSWLITRIVVSSL